MVQLQDSTAYDLMPADRPIGWALIGTGFAASRRAQVLLKDDRSRLVAVASRDRLTANAFCEQLSTPCCDLTGFDANLATIAPPPVLTLGDWRSLLNLEQVDVIAVCNLPYQHAEIVEACLLANKHVVVEYPLALDPASAAALLQLARSRRRLLHVEHIELLSGVHQALRQSLAAIGTPYQARYVTISPKTPAPRRWSYNHQAFGFPFIGALSRVMRLVDAFGAVEAVTATAQFWGDGENSGDRPYPSTDLPIDLQTELQTNSQANSPTYYQGCWCAGELRFLSGMTAQVIYAKGERLWQAQNQLEVHGAGGSLHLSPTRGQLWTAAGAMELTIGDRRGLFGKDTLMVNDALQTGTPLYVQPEQSLYALRVAAALHQAVQERSLVKLFC